MSRILTRAERVIFLAEHGLCRQRESNWERPDACEAGVKEPWARSRNDRMVLGAGQLEPSEPAMSSDP